jgi:membrane protease YdiL (CAAX protease family)
MKRNLGIVGIYITGFFLVNVILAVYIIASGMDLNDTEALNSLATNYTAVFYIATSILFLIVFRRYIKEQGTNFFKDFKRNFLYIVAGLFIIYGAMFLMGLIMMLLGVETEADNQQAIIDMIIYSTDIQMILIILFVVVGAPLVEEMVFRKGIYGLIGILTTKLLLSGDVPKNKRKVLVIANIAGLFISSLTFGLMHATDIYLLVYASLGLVLGFIYFISKKNILVSIFVHMIYNSISLALTIFAI